MSHEAAPSTPAQPSGVSRRDFLKTTAVAAATTVVAGCAAPGAARGPGAERAPAVRPAGVRPERLRVGLIGCGGRGTGAAIDCVNAAKQLAEGRDRRAALEVEVWAMGDAFADHLAGSRETLAKELGPAMQVSEERCFTGLEAYRKVIAAGVDLVIMATPPGFRPLHLEAAIKAGKHVFMEKPVAVDPVGVRSVIASSELAQTKGLGIVCGTQRRHQPAYLATMKRIHGGAIGNIVAAQCYWNQGELWVKPRQPEWSDVEWQCRNWLYFTWLSGDHIVEQHVHNLDVINWALEAHPVRCVGLGGRQVRTGPEFGNIYDHFAVEYEYPGGVRVLSTCRQIKGCSDRVSERIVGTRGTAEPAGRIDGTAPWKHTWKYAETAAGKKGQEVNPYVQEHADLLASIRRGRPLNEGRRIAESTLTAIMGRMSAYTGREVSWDWVMKQSQLNLLPEKLEFGDLPVGPVAMPGETQLV